MGVSCGSCDPGRGAAVNFPVGHYNFTGVIFLLCDFLRTGTRRKMRGFPGTAVLTAQQHHAHPEKGKA